MNPHNEQVARRQRGGSGSGAIEEQFALARVARERCGLLEFGAGFFQAAELRE